MVSADRARKCGFFGVVLDLQAHLAAAGRRLPAGGSGSRVRRRSDKRQAHIDEAPAVRSVSDDRTAVVGATDESLREFVRRLPCAVCLRPTLGGDPCHVRAKRRFGDWLEREGRVVGNLFPGCADHHAEQHRIGVWSFEGRHGVDLAAVAEAVGLAYLAGHEPEAVGAAALRGGYLVGMEIRPGLPEF